MAWAVRPWTPLPRSGSGVAWACRLSGALRRVDIWGRLLLGPDGQDRRGLRPHRPLHRHFTGVVMALQASYTFTGAVPLYFVGALVGKTMILELGPVLTGLGSVRAGWGEHRRGAGDHEGDGTDRCPGNAGLRSGGLSGGAAGAGRDHHGSRWW